MTDEIPKANIPHVNSFFINNESENPSLRLLRPSLQLLPLNYKYFIDAGLLFGIYLQPFAEICENEYNLENTHGSEIQSSIPCIEGQ